MRFLKILGMVVALHVVLFTVFLLSPGCQSNPTTPAPTAADPASQAAAPASTLAPMPVDEMGNYTSQPAPKTAATGSANPVSTTISSTPLPGVPATAADSGRSTPVRPSNPESYVSTGTTLPTALNPTTHVIRAGDTLAKIAAKYGTTVSALQKANPGIKPQSLGVGQVIKLPANIAAQSTTSGGEAAPAATSGAKYTVKSGDSLSAIAARNGTTVSALRQANNLRSDTLQVGQTLIIPGVSSPVSAPANSGYSPAPATSRPAPTISGDASTTTIEHTLKSGETLGGLAKRYGVSVDQIMAANNITDARKIRAGQKLVIPGSRGAAPAAASTPRATTPAPAVTTPAPAPVTPAPATDPIPVDNGLLPEPQPAIPADMMDAPPIPVDEPTPTP
jgi:LysM repeat protein